MKKKSLFIGMILLLGMVSLQAQNGVYMGGEFANKRDYYHFTNNQGTSVNQGMLCNSYGIYLGYQFKRFSYETGLFQYTSSVPEITYDWDKERAHFGRGAHSTSANTMQVIPLRAGYDFLSRHKGLYLQPSLGLLLIYNHTEPNERVFAWSIVEEAAGSYLGIGISGDTILPVPSSGKFSHGTGYSTTPLNLGFQAGLRIGYRIKEKLDIYLGISASGSLNLLYFENVLYQYDEELIAGTTSFSGNSTTLQLGIKYYLKRKDIYKSKP